MADLWSANTRTQGRIGLTGSKTGVVNTSRDIDWLRVRLTRGQAYTVVLVGVTLRDPFLEIHDSRGRRLAYNDDFGGSRDSGLFFRAPYTGTFFLAASSSINRDTGTYAISIRPYRRSRPAAVADRSQALTAQLDAFRDRPLASGGSPALRIRRADTLRDTEAGMLSSWA